jgi:class 3 adenylate cyclase
VLSDTVNTTARLMGKAVADQILLTESVYERITQHFDCASLGSTALKGKGAPVPLFALQGQKTHHST